ncbi:hypothetical protein F5876DRAFT_72071 [Lentinula aff. lateritia]|uniref:Uncharacterized protein n=1 Tax=Lentinula aff. lateritia TaxID=2804960 RepID=A0ACC1UF56_9AGAR|nr:hypothetical protein F5876DRAFT_72071 [Lentinula aff. lateritia]
MSFSHFGLPRIFSFIPDRTRYNVMPHEEGRKESPLNGLHDQDQLAHSSSVRPKDDHGIPQEHRDQQNSQYGWRDATSPTGKDNQCNDTRREFKKAQPDANAAVTVPSTTAIREHHDDDRMNTQSASTDSQTETFQSNCRTHSGAVQSAPSPKGDRKTDAQAATVPEIRDPGNTVPSQSSGRGPSGSIETDHCITRNTSLHGTDERADRNSSGVLRESLISSKDYHAQIVYAQQKSLEEQLLNVQRRDQKMEAQLGNAQHCLRKQENEIGELRKHLMNEQAAAVRYRKKDAHNRELLDTRMKELQGARAFLNTSDMHSGADIVSMVKTLNAEIFQAAASITDTIVDFMSGQVSLEKNLHHSWAVDIVSKTLGEEVATLLHDHDVAVDEHMTLVQIALQAGLNQRSQYVLCLWALPGEVNDAINGAFAGIQMQQKQAVVYRTWRSLTKAQTKRTVYQDPRLHKYFAGIVKALLIVAGWWPSQSSEIAARIESNIRGRISAIVLLLEKLDTAMTQITSMDLTLEMPTPGVNFDAQRMQDEDGKGSLIDKTVLFTSEIGLKMKSVDIDGRSEEAVLLKPKVSRRALNVTDEIKKY